MACSTWGRAGRLTRVEPLTTRETVARDPPASAATSSRVGCTGGRTPSPVIVTSPPRFRWWAVQTIASDGIAIPQSAVLEQAPSGRVVHVHDTEALRVPLCPLEVVQQGPDEV